MTTSKTAGKARTKAAGAPRARTTKATAATTPAIPAKKMLKALSAAARLEALLPGPGGAKAKLVRDSFTIPKSEYLVLAGLKDRAARLMRPTKKSEILRAGIAALQAMKDGSFLAALNDVPSLKTGRPRGSVAQPTARARAK